MFKGKGKINTKILTLGPRIVKNETSKKYVDKLERLLKLKECKNIAIIGNYGSGKSSIIKTFFHKKWKNRRHSLTITIGSYIVDNDIFINSDDPATSDNEISFKEQILVNRVEESILKQIIYRKKFTKFPKSSLIRYDKESWCKKIFYSSIVLYSIWFGIYYYYKFFNDQVLDFKKIYNFFGVNMIIMLSIIILIVFKIIKTLINKIRINKIKIKDCEIELHHDSNSLFSKYLTEIIYYFQISKYNLVIFEDLDRFPQDIALKVIQELKELNTILNDSYGIKKLVFIYAIKDDLFKRLEDKNKFYDYNLSILPISTAFNSELNLVGLLKKQNVYQELSSKVISTISKYVFDMRTLINIINDYCLFKELTNTKNYDKLFAMVTFKNYYYMEYNKMFESNREDLIHKSFETFTKKRDELLDALDEKKHEVEVSIDKIKSEILVSKRELKELLLAKNTYGDNNDYYINCYYLNSTEQGNISDFLEDDFDINLLEDNTFTLRISNGVEISENNVFRFFESKDKFLERYKNTNKDTEILSLESKIDSINLQKEKLKSMSVNEIFQKYYDKSILKTTENNSLLNDLIRFGFITNDYMDYVTSPVIYGDKNNSESLMYSDSQFLMNVRQEKYSFDIKLTGFETIINIISDNLDTPYILNFDLLNYLLEHKLDEYSSKIFCQFKEPNTINMEFLISFIKKYPDKCNYIFNKLTKENYDIWSFISKNDNSFSMADKQFLFINILHHNEYIPCIEDKDSLKQFCESKLELNDKKYINEILYNQTVRESLLVIKPRMKNISIFDENNYDFIYKNNLYSFESSNIYRILGTEKINFNLLKLDSESKKLYYYIKDNINAFCEEYYKKYDYIINDLEIIMDMVYSTKIDLETKEILYKREKFKLRNIDNVEKELYISLVVNDHLYINWKNITNLYKKIDDVVLFEYATKSITKLISKLPLKNIEQKNIDNFFENYILYLIKIDLKNTENILQFINPKYEQINDLNSNELILLIKYQCLMFNKNNYKYICEQLSSNERESYIYDYFNSNVGLTEIVNTISISDLEILLHGDKINNDDKIKLIYAIYKKEKRKDSKESFEQFIDRLKMSFKSNRNYEITYNQTIYTAILRKVKNEKIFVKLEIVNNKIKFKL